MMRDFNKGFIDSLPTLPSFSFVGIMFGISGIEHGLGLTKTILMSAVMFHGAAQFIALSLMTADSGITAILIAITFMNCRYLMCGASLAIYLRDLSMKKVLLISSMVTIPTFAVAMNRFRKEEGSWLYLFGLHLISYLTWVVGTTVGALIGMKIPLFLQKGMGFTFYALLIGVLWIGYRGFKSIVNIGLCGMISILIYHLTPYNINIILSPLFSATMMIFGEKWKQKLIA